jgi:hypothetical protein
MPGNQGAALVGAGILTMILSQDSPGRFLPEGPVRTGLLSKG